SLALTDTPPPACYPLSLHDALPISITGGWNAFAEIQIRGGATLILASGEDNEFGGTITNILSGAYVLNGVHVGDIAVREGATLADRKSTRLNSSHVKISYAVFCLKK